MKRIVLVLFILSSIIGCTRKKENKENVFDEMIDHKIAERDSLTKLYCGYLEILEQINWTQRFQERILEDNPSFRLDSSKTASYFVVPVLTIPDSVLIRDSINMVKYFEKGTLTVDGAECYVLEDEIPVATLILSDQTLIPVRPEIFKDYIRNRNIGEVRKS